MMRPEWALPGTVTTSPAAVWRRRAPGVLWRELTRAFGVDGKTTSMPLPSPTPCTSSVPRTVTWRGFVPQCELGTQLTDVMRADLTCRVAPLEEAAGLLALGAVAGVLVPGEAVPPAPAASVACGAPSSAASASAAAVTNTDVVRL